MAKMEDDPGLTIKKSYFKRIGKKKKGCNDGHDPNTPILCCKFNRNAWNIISGGADNSICLWDLNRGSKSPVERWTDAHRGWIRCVAPHTESENFFVSSGSDMYIKLWDTRDFQHPKFL